MYKTPNIKHAVKAEISMKTILSSNHTQYQSTLMFNKVYGIDVQSLTVFRENGKLWNLHFHPKFSKSWTHQIAHIKHWIINDLTNDRSVMVWYKHDKRKFEIIVAFLSCRSSIFWKTVEKKWWGIILKKAKTFRISHQGHQNSVKKCSFQVFGEIERKMVNSSFKEKEFMISG